MANNLYVTATEARSGKSAISLGVMEMLLRKVDRVGFFRPIIGNVNSHRDHDIELISAHYDLDLPYEKMYGFTSAEAQRMQAQGRESEIIEEILKKYDFLRGLYDFVLCEGTDFGTTSSAFELDINAEIASNLAAPVLLVGTAHNKERDELLRSMELALESLQDKGCRTVATIVNRVDLREEAEILKLLQESPLTSGQLVYAVPNIDALGAPTMEEVAEHLGARVLYGKEMLKQRHVYNSLVAAMQLRNFLTRLSHGSLVITPGDRADVIVASLASLSSSSFRNIAGIVLTGGLMPEEPILQLIDGFSRLVPILSVQEDTYQTARAMDRIHARIRPDNMRKIDRTLALFERRVDVERLAEKIITEKTTIVTPKMFEFELLQKARHIKQHVVLPEGEEERILRAAEMLVRRDVVDLTLLGDARKIKEKISQFNLNLEEVSIVEPASSPLLQDFAQTYFELRKHKGVTEEHALDTMRDVNYFGAMMIHKGLADAMVSGSVHTTAATIRPALEFIKTRPGSSIVSSVFFMCLEDRVLVYGDCAINPNPSAQQLAEIALASARTAMTFGVEPRVAMLSYSTGESGQGQDVDRVREATRLARETAANTFPGLKIEGPIQYDAAVDMDVARTKMPDSEVAGRATVFIFPDLNTGNNTYKAVQRSAGAVAVGPVLQGLNHPVNDLSRGCTIPDIVNTVAITAIQAQAEKGLI